MDFCIDYLLSKMYFSCDLQASALKTEPYSYTSAMKTYLLILIPLKLVFPTAQMKSDVGLWVSESQKDLGR